MKSRATSTVLAILLASFSGRLVAGEGALTLVDDPAIIARIKAMKKNSAMLLPPFKTAGIPAGEKHTWNFAKNGPYKRDWSNKMPYNSDLKIGMYAGGNHGNPKYNDCWGYHLGSNTWHRLFAPVGGDQGRNRGWVKGAKEKNRQMVKDIVVFEEGYLQTKGHGPYYISHLWDGITYDPEAKRMLWVNPFSYDNLEGYAGVIGQDYEKLKAQAKEGTKVWMYDIAKGRWFKHIGAKPYPRFDVSTCGASLLYISDWKKSLYYSAGWKSPGTWTYDAVNNVWARLKVKVKAGKGTKPPQDKQMVYSPKHKKIVAVFETKTWILNIKTLTWSKGPDHATNDASDGYALFTYSPETDEFLLLSGKSRKRKKPIHLSAFSLQTMKWREIKYEGPVVDQKSYPGGFFHPDLGVLVVYTGDRDSKYIWVYRP